MAGSGEGPGGKVDDLSKIFDDALEEAFKDEKPEPPAEPPVEQPVTRPSNTSSKTPANRPASRSPSRPTSKPTTTSAPSSTTTTPSQNTPVKSGVQSIVNGLNTLFDNDGTTLGSGFVIDPEKYAKAKEFFIEAIKQFKIAVKDAVAAIKAIITNLKNNGLTERAIANMKPYVLHFADDLRNGRVPELEEPPKPPKQKEQETDFQVEYKPGSDMESVGTLVPVLAQEAIQRALASVKKAVSNQYGSLDEYVAKKLGYKDAEEIRKNRYFSAEQMDALAVAIYNSENNGGFIIGDMTGVGKGRFVAGMIRYAMQHGKVPVFVTQAPGLYADMYRDLNDIGIPEFNAFVTNKDLRGDQAIPLPARNENEEDGDRKLVSSKKIDQEMVQIAEQGLDKFPYHAVFTTYSQMQGIHSVQRRAFLRAIAPQSMIILDESHEAGGSEKKDRGKPPPVPPRAEFFRDVIAVADSVVYSSATFAKRPDVMDLYNRTSLSLLGASNNSLDKLFSKGGVPMQQIVSNMLVEDGNMMRRERSYAGVDFNMTPVEVDMELADEGASLLGKVFRFDRLMEQVRKDAAGAANEGGVRGGAGGQALGDQASAGTSFAAIMHNLSSQLLLALKAPSITEMAIEAVKSGQKPVIAVSNTMGAIINDYIEQTGLQVGKEAKDFDLSAVFDKYLERTRYITVKDPVTRKATKRRLSDEEIGPEMVAMFEAIRDDIANSPIRELPGSPLDYIQSKLRAAGIKIGEITGRGAVMNYDSGAPVLETRDPSGAAKKRTMTAFNKGELDALLLNKSGSTGYSLHASRTFKDQRQRHMLLAQGDPDINVFMQMLGRIHRTGQVVLPTYTLAPADLPSEKRPMAVLMKKMGSLNANTTASKKGNVKLDVTDFVNEVGDEIANQMLQEDPELRRALNLRPADISEGERATGMAAKLTGRMIVLPLEQQNALVSELERQFKQTIQALDDLGQNPLEAPVLDLDAKPGAKTLLAEGAGGKSVFGQPAYLQEVDMRRTFRPYSPEEIRERVAAGKEKAPTDGDWNDLSTRVEGYVERLQTRVREMTETLRGLDPEDEKFQDKKRALEAKIEGVEKEAERVTEQHAAIFNKLNPLLDDERNPDPFPVKIGRMMDLSPNVVEHGGDGPAEHTLHGVVIGISMDKKGGGNPVALSKFTVKLAVANGSSATVDVPLSKIMTPVGDENHTPRYDLRNSRYSSGEMMDLFANSQGTGRETRLVAVGNLPLAYTTLNPESGRQSGGQISFIKTADGSMIQGIVLPRDASIRTILENAPVKLVAADQVERFFDIVGTRGKLTTEDGGLSLAMDQAGNFVFRANNANREHVKYRTSNALREILGRDFTQNRSNRDWYNTARKSRALEAFHYLVNEGAAVFVADADSTSRNAARQAAAERPAPTPPSPTAGGINSASLNAGLDPVEVMKALNREWYALKLALKTAMGMDTRIPGITANVRNVENRVNPLARFLKVPEAVFNSQALSWFRPLYHKGLEAEQKLSIITTGFQNEYYEARKGLSDESFAKVSEALFEADASGFQSKRDLEQFTQGLSGRGFTDKEVQAFRDIRRVFDKIGRLVDLHNRSMLPRVRRAKHRAWMSLVALTDPTQVDDLKRAIHRREEALRKLQYGLEDPALLAEKIDKIDDVLSRIEPADPKRRQDHADIMAELFSLQARLRNTSIRRKIGYVPHVFFGGWRLFENTGVDANGEPIWEHIAGPHGFFQTQADAELAAKEYRKNNPNAGELKYEPVQFKFPGGGRGSVLSDASYYRLTGAIAQQFGISDQEAQGMLQQGIAAKAGRRRFANFARFRKDVPGYSRDLDRVMNTHITQAARYVSLDGLKYDYVTMRERAGLSPYSRASSERKDLIDFLENWFKDINGNPQDWEQSIDNWLEKRRAPLFAIGAAGVTTIAAGAAFSPLVGITLGTYAGYRLIQAIRAPTDFKTRALVSNILRDQMHLKLGILNIGSALVNMTQNVFTMSALGEKYWAKGVGMATRAFADHAMGKNTHYARLLDKADIQGVFRFGEDSSRMFKKEGVVSKISMFAFNSVESTNRAIAFMGAYQQALDQGMNEAQAIRAGRAMVTKTQFHQGNANKPEVLRKTILKPMTQFKNFMFQSVAFASGLAVTDKPALIKFMAYLTLMAGALGFPGFQLLDWMLRIMTDGYISVADQLRRFAIDKVGDLNGTAASFLLRGLPAMAGFNMTSRVGMGEGFLPSQPSDLMGPAIGTVANLYKLDKANAGMADYVRTIAPSLGNPLKSFEAWNNGVRMEDAVRQSWDRNLARLTDDQRDWIRTYKDTHGYEPTNRDLMYRSIGLQPLAEALRQDVDSLNRADKQEFVSAMAPYKSKLVQIMRAERDDPKVMGEKMDAVIREAEEKNVQFGRNSIRSYLREAETPAEVKAIKDMPRHLRGDAERREKTLVGMK